MSSIKFMECDARRWAMLEAEPDIWLVIIVSKAWGGPGCSNSSLSTALIALHQLFVVLHQPLSHLIDQVS